MAALISALRPGDRQLQLSAIRALGKFGPAARSAAPALREFVYWGYLRDEASEALQRIQPGRAAAVPGRGLGSALGSSRQ